MAQEAGAKKNVKNKKKVKVFTKKKQKAKVPETELIKKLTNKYNEIDINKIDTFTDLPLSPKTQKALKECGYVKPTEIQKNTISLSLQGKDILGAAQTGSGKTLAFIIPVLETLYCNQWTKLDGVGALVITPTRELAYQIFETLRKVGVYHDFSASLIIGGKDLHFEKKRMDQYNIVICTPGRILQHMDENPLFDCVNMKILVLDEADRCLDMGFANTMDAIVANLPPVRQTLLFSATQTKSIKDLARLSLKDASYVSVHEHAKHGTPTGLEQSYVVCELQDKMSILWSFIKNHLKKKTIIFFSTCKEVKFFFDVFSKLRPGVSLLPLYGTLHQLRRMKIYESFRERKAAVLFSTDLAARGLDFPLVDWVIQADCPEDTDTYIHRVGRTARYNRGGESLLMLLPSEIAIVDDLVAKKIPIDKIEINPKQLQNPVRKISAYLASNSELKDTAKRAVVHYAKSVFLMKNKKYFDATKLDTDKFSESLGLSVPPRVRILERHNARKDKNIKIDSVRTDKNIKNHDKSVIEIKFQGVGQNKITKFDALDNNEDESKMLSEDSDDDFLKVKRKNHDIEDLPPETEIQPYTGRTKKPLTKVAIAKRFLKKNIVPNKKIIFDDAGDPVVQQTKEQRTEMALQYENEDFGGIDLEKSRMVLREEDKLYDKVLFKEKVKAKKKEVKRKLKEKKLEEEKADDFSSGSEYEPDLSWLPDPDKIYGEKDDDNEIDEEENYIDDNEEVIEETIVKKSKKRKPTKKNEKTTKTKRKKIENLEDLTVNEVEELALSLLSRK